jgi:hypothetical protein
MGKNLSIDKHVSSLEELLEMSASYFNKVKFESKISPSITQHLKVSWSLKNSTKAASYLNSAVLKLICQRWLIKNDAFLFIDLEVC